MKKKKQNIYIVYTINGWDIDRILGCVSLPDDTTADQLERMRLSIGKSHAEKHEIVRIKPAKILQVYEKAF